MIKRDLMLFFMRLAFGAYPQWRGSVPSSKQRVYFANHTSNADTVIMLAALPSEFRNRIRPVAAKDYWGTGGIRRYISHAILNVVLIDRKREEDQDPLTPIRAVLNEGDSLIIFPEGKRNQEEEPGDFKAGIYKLAKEYPDIEFVPVYLENLNRIMPKGKVLPLPLISKVYFGEPVKLETGESREAFLARARQAVVDAKGV